MIPETNPQRDFVARLNEGFAGLAGWSYDHRWWVVAAALALLAGSLALASRAQIDSSFEAYFDPSDPAYLHYEQYREEARRFDREPGSNS